MAPSSFVGNCHSVGRILTGAVTSRATTRENVQLKTRNKFGRAAATLFCLAPARAELFAYSPTRVIEIIAETVAPAATLSLGGLFVRIW